MSHNSIKPIFGSAMLSSLAPDDETVQDVFRRLEEGGVTTLDVTPEFAGAEEYLGKTKAGTRFIINSKTPGGIVPGTSTSTGIMKGAKHFTNQVGPENVDVYVIHAPDPTIELADTCKGMNDAYQAGYFKRLGLSNFTAEEVEAVYALCKEKGYVLPTVYEGNYNAVARKAEKSLLPTLRRLGMSFYAYSPIAGGLLTKTVQQLKDKTPEAGRFGGNHMGSQMYNSMYNKPTYYQALDMWSEAAKTAGCSNAELAYRWVAFDSPLTNEHGDALLFGCSKREQISEVLDWLKKGSVGSEATKKIDEIWKVVEQSAPVDNYQSFWRDNVSNQNHPFED